MHSKRLLRGSWRHGCTMASWALTAKSLGHHQAGQGEGQQAEQRAHGCRQGMRFVAERACYTGRLPCGVTSGWHSWGLPGHPRRHQAFHSTQCDDQSSQLEEAQMMSRNVK